MAKKVKKNNEIDLSKQDIFTPISTVDVLGSKKDPCFGKLFDLTTSECKQCGDSELCAICFAQSMNKTREDIEKENHFKDLDTLVDIKGVKKYIRALKRKDKPKKEIINMVIKKFEITKEDARSIYRSLKSDS